jgi:hypothetical protein
VFLRCLLDPSTGAALDMDPIVAECALPIRGYAESLEVDVWPEFS